MGRASQRTTGRCSASAMPSETLALRRAPASSAISFMATAYGGRLREPAASFGTA